MIAVDGHSQFLSCYPTDAQFELHIGLRNVSQ